MDLYLGAAITDDSEVKVDRYFSRESASERTSYDTSFTFGGRIGYWLDIFHYLGFAADLSYFKADSEKVDFSIVPFSILVMLRWPLLISTHPKTTVFGLAQSAISAQLSAKYT